MVLWAFGPFFEVVMLVLRSSWRYLAALAALGVLTLSTGCGGKSEPADTTSTTPTYTVAGTVKYTRIPLVTNATTGMPIGLETDPAKFVELPSRGVVVRALQGKEEIDAEGKTVMVWKAIGSVTTDTAGAYKLTVEGKAPAFIEVMGTLQSGFGSPVRLIAADIGSSLPIIDRLVYALRKGADGSSPAGNATPGAIITADSTVDFKVGITTPWWITPSTPNLIADAKLETTGSGSRILGILDSAYTFASSYGDATPGANLNLHYQPGTAWSFGTRPSFVEYDRDVYPASFDGSSFHYFGAIRAASGLDDTWNEAALFSLFSRNWMTSQRITSLLPTQPLSDGSDLQDLVPEMAILEGFAPSIAAVLMKSPFLAQNLSATPTVRDVRANAGLGSDAYSAATISALAWEVALKASSLPSPGTPTDWSKLDHSISKRFFAAVVPKDASNNPTDTVNLYSQIARLKETKAGSETVDLAAIFTDTALTTLLSPFNITWPRPTTGPEAGYLVDWGKDPNSLVTALPGFSLSMAKAHLNGLGVFPNHSKGEVFLARFLLSRDRSYKLSVQTPGGIPAGAQIEVTIDGKSSLFSASVTSMPPFTLLGNATTPVYHFVQVRLLSPAVQQSDLPITLRLDAQN